MGIPFFSPHLVADAGWSAADAGLLSVRVAKGQVRVSRALQAAVGVGLDEEAGGAGHAGGGVPSGVQGHQRTRPARGRHAIRGVGHGDGVDLDRVAEETPRLGARMHTQRHK